MFESAEFWAIFVVAAGGSFVLDESRVRARAALLYGASLLALYLVVNLPPPLIALVGAAPAWVWFAGRITRGLATRRPYAASLIALAPILIAWIVGKQGMAVDDARYGFLYFVGFSYVLIKSWTYLKDLHDGRIERDDPVIVAAYLLHFPTYVAGPMHLFGEYDETIRRPLKLGLEDAISTLFRILLGFVKVKLIAPLIVPFSLIAVRDNEIMEAGPIFLGALAYSFVIWLDFSGYSDLAISFSRILGIRTPENFNNPYLARNIREFWQRWHISFSRVLTSYIFVPLTRNLYSRLGNRRRAISTTGYLVTFAFAGYWHGPTANFILWGVYHALGFIAFDLYREFRRGRPRKLKENRALAWIERGGGILITFGFVTLGWILFVLPLGAFSR